MITEIPKEEFATRISNVQKILQERSIDILVTTGSDAEHQNLIYLANYWPAF